MKFSEVGADVRITFADQSWIRLFTGSPDTAERLAEFLSGAAQGLSESALSDAQRQRVSRFMADLPDTAQPPVYTRLASGIVLVEARVPAKAGKGLFETHSILMDDSGVPHSRSRAICSTRNPQPARGKIHADMSVWEPEADEVLLARAPVTFASGATTRVSGMRWFRDQHRADIQGELVGWPPGPTYTAHSASGTVVRNTVKGVAVWTLTSRTLPPVDQPIKQLTVGEARMNRRRTAAVIATAGALALSVLNAPAAQAKDTGIDLSDLVINNGKPIVAGTSRVVEPPISFNIALPPGTTRRPVPLFRVPLPVPGKHHGGGRDRRGLHRTGRLHLLRAEPQAGPLRGDLYIDPHPSQEHVDSNSDATSWKIGVSLRLFPPGDGPVVAEERETRSRNRRPPPSRQASVADATPEPVTKGKKLTLKSKLTRANWTTKKNDAYAGSTVSLQFRAKNATSFKTLKKVRTNSAGALSTTVTATTDGFFRWVYYGNTTTGTATSAQDYVDVR